MYVCMYIYIYIYIYISYIILQNDLNMVNSWAEKWMVNFNPQKTEAMFITRKHDENMSNPIYTFKLKKYKMSPTISI